MRGKVLVLAMATFVPATVASAQQPEVIVGQPGPYEFHYYLHRTRSFDRPPYFAQNPPVYYGDQRYARSYGWTPYPYLGSQKPGKMVTPLTEKQGASLLPPKSKKVSITK